MALIALAGSTGLEPATSDVTGRRSNQTELTPQADVRVCFRSRALRGLVYTEVCPARNNFFEKIFRSLREGLRGWGRGLSLLLYSPAQDGKHIKCFPLRAELATNLNGGPPGPGIRRARRGNVTCQKGTGLFWSVLSGETSRSNGDLLSPVAWKSAALSEVCGKFRSPRAHPGFSPIKPQVQSLGISSVLGLFKFCRILPKSKFAGGDSWTVYATDVQ